ncbi:Sodium/solute symporter [Operophtera brumata]|uniref:Sodium/solute symporter n=1 Tax=Operophtera brumata TaxID=104452 RepID=A0A0L7KM35_OPEBR|nr:Sodium/solute symporter [Operophtera brumata]
MLCISFRADVIQTVAMILVSGAFIIQSTFKAGGPRQVSINSLCPCLSTAASRPLCNATAPCPLKPAASRPSCNATAPCPLKPGQYQLFMSVSIYGCQQTFVQRYCSMSSEARLVSTLYVRVYLRLPAVLRATLLLHVF